MIKIYIRDGCPFCTMVLAKADALGLKIEEKNVSNPAVADELIQLGGKKQEPFLYDDEKDIKMYESHEIGEYLDETYGNREGEAKASEEVYST